MFLKRITVDTNKKKCIKILLYFRIKIKKLESLDLEQLMGELFIEKSNFYHFGCMNIAKSVCVRWWWGKSEWPSVSSWRSRSGLNGRGYFEALTGVRRNLKSNIRQSALHAEMNRKQRCIKPQVPALQFINARSHAPAFVALLFIAPISGRVNLQLTPYAP